MVLPHGRSWLAFGERPRVKRLLEQGTLWGLAVILGALGVGYAFTGGAGGVASDDGWELGKIQFAVQHPELLGRVWNDQPWLHTLINATLCRWLGEGPWVPRGFTVVSVAAMWVALAWMGGGRLGWLGMVAAGLLWAGCRSALNVGFAAMLEGPALAWAVVAAALLAQAAESRPWLWVAASGAVMAAALHLKLTAAVIAPGLALLGWRLFGWRGSLRLAPIWLMGWAVTFAALAWISPSFRWEWLLGSHWAARSGALADPTFDPGPVPLLGTVSPTLLVGGVFGLMAVVRTGLPPVGVFAVGAWLGALLFKAVAYPWWPYYEFHFAVPLAVLGGLAVASAAQSLRAWWGGTTRAGMASHPKGLSSEASTMQPWAGVIVLSTLAALWVGFGTSALHGFWANVVIQGNRLNAVFSPHLQETAGKARWCYAGPHYYPELAHARILPPPELLILPRKRFWSGQITWSKVTEYLDAYEVEWLILEESVELAQPVFVAWLTNRYEEVTSRRSAQLWRRKVPAMVPAPSADDG